jgi:hypothetical protein
MAKIYKLKDPDTLETRYIGKTLQPLKYRLAGHISRSKKYRTAYINCWVYKLLQEGKKPIIELIEECDNWEEREQYWINFYPNLCNHQQGGGHGNSGTSLSEEHKLNISNALKGKPRSENTKRKISESHKGKIVSDSTKQKLREFNLGKIIPLRVRKNMSKGGVEQYTKDGVLINTYYSLTDAVNQTGLLKGNLSSACTGRLKTCGGFIWKYKS